ncbi:PREDICTED: probable mediator of RNA polymerase II transcription subunit 15c, partial [Camelina sativa]|uniref:Probable mediator of RNA polymerase II transcription subunit 15c n=1 Tax=Camelina sativa TaxID=90675 RepID=A0ABM1RKU3_CAMSA
MEENTNCKPNELGGASDANNANDWRSQHEPQLRKGCLSKIVEFLMEIFPMRGDVSDIASKIEEKTYNVAVDKTDYIRKLKEQMHAIKTYKNVQSGSSANGANTPAPARVGMNQAQLLPTSLPYTQTPTSQRGLLQNTPSNLNVPSRLPTQAPLTASMAQNVNIHIGEGGQVNVVPGSQREMQGRQYHLPQQHQLNQYLLKEKTCHGNLRPPHMHPQSLLKQPIQQSLSQSSDHSSLSSSGQQTSIQQNSQLLPGHHFPTQQVRSSSQPQMVLLSQEHSELMDVPNTHQNHPTSQQNIQEQQGAFSVSSSQENNVASSQKKPHHNNNTLQTMPPQRLNNASGVPSQRHHQSGNYNAPGSSLLGTHGQEVGQSQPMMSQQYQPPYPMHQQPQKRSSQQYLDSSQNYTQRFQSSSSLHQTQKIANQQNHPHPSQRAPLANPSSNV